MPLKKNSLFKPHTSPLRYRDCGFRKVIAASASCGDIYIEPKGAKFEVSFVPRDKGGFIDRSPAKRLVPTLEKAKVVAQALVA